MKKFSTKSSINDVTLRSVAVRRRRGQWWQGEIVISSIVARDFRGFGCDVSEGMWEGAGMSPHQAV